MKQTYTITHQSKHDYVIPTWRPRRR